MTTTSISSLRSTLTGKELADISRKTASESGPGTVKRFFEANRANLEALLPKHFPVERMLKLALGALRTTPKLAQATNASLLGSVVTCSQLGLEPNTPLGQAYLLPFDKREKVGDKWQTTETQVQIIIGYKGMLDLARRSGQIVSIAAHEVCEHDEFEFCYGLDETLMHRPAMRDRGAVIGFYAVAKLVGGGYSFEFMSTDEVNAIRDKSAEKNRAKRGPDGRPIITGPWAEHYVEMGRKTVLRRLFKYLPISVENLSFATAIDGTTVAAPSSLEDTVFESAPVTEIHEDEPLQIEHQTSTMPSAEEISAINAQEMAEAAGEVQPPHRQRRERGGMVIE